MKLLRAVTAIILGISFAITGVLLVPMGAGPLVPLVGLGAGIVMCNYGMRLV